MKKVNKFVYTLIIGLMSFSSFAQKKITLTLKYDQEYDRYEVCAKPNFSERDFTWGPSQISLVLPATALVEKIRVMNIDGGAWEDNSVVQTPEITPNVSYHGLNSGGDKTDLVENNETILFYFSLPKGINVNEVRIFDNDKDPDSRAKGMLGGDFGNSIIDYTGKDHYAGIYSDTKKAALRKENLMNDTNTDFSAITYPNVITENKFQVSLNGINDQDGNVLMILATDTGKELLRIKDTKSNIEKQTIKLDKNVSQQGLVIRFISAKGAISKRLLVENER